MNPKEMIIRYNDLTLQYGRQFGHPVRDDSKRNLEIAEQFLSWCRANDVEPNDYLREIFRVTMAKYRRSPQFKLGYLTSDKVFAVWKGNRERKVLQARLAQNIVSASQPLQDRIRALVAVLPSQEQFRRAEHPAVCRSLSMHSGGYHPRSAKCPTCPLAVTCAYELNQREGFDVVSLRAGRTGALPSAVVEALAAIG